MKTYSIKTVTVVHTYYIAEAENKKEARRMLFDGELEQPDDENCDIDNVDVVSIEEVQSDE